MENLNEIHFQEVDHELAVKQVYPDAICESFTNNYKRKYYRIVIISIGICGFHSSSKKTAWKRIYNELQQQNLL